MSEKFKAVPALVLRNARGEVVPMKAGPCIWCGQIVKSRRDVAGATNPADPCWAIDGDFGCIESPESNDDGTGNHARPWDLAYRLLKEMENT